MPAFKLTREQALEARALYQQHVPRREIAAKYNVTPAAISALIRGETWGFKNISRGQAKGEDNNAKLTKADVRAIRRQHSEGISQHALAAKYGVDQAEISLIVRRKKWAHLDAPTP